MEGTGAKAVVAVGPSSQKRMIQGHLCEDGLGGQSGLGHWRVTTAAAPCRMNSLEGPCAKSLVLSRGATKGGNDKAKEGKSTGARAVCFWEKIMDSFEASGIPLGVC